jgi:hypothetical protein
LSVEHTGTLHEGAALLFQSVTLASGHDAGIPRDLLLVRVCFDPCSIGGGD